MSFLELVKKRKSVRNYKPKPVSDEDLDYVLEAGRLAPSWGNRQCWRYIVIKDQKKREAISSRDWIANAPVIIVGCAYPDRSGSNADQQYYMLDMGISMEHMALAAADRDLGTCWIGGQFTERWVKEELSIPKDVRVAALLTLGHPAEEPSTSSRKDGKEFATHGKWK